MNPIESVFDLSEKFMKNPKFVFIDEENIERVVREIKNLDVPKFPLEKIQDNVANLAFKELVAGAVNYCYWYGKHDIRPQGCSSTKMYELLEDAYSRSNSLTIFCDLFLANLAKHRFPLLEERVQHVLQVHKAYKQLLNSTEFISQDLIGSFELLIKWFPGYASDMFLKRASLFFLMLYRKYGWFEKDIHKLHVPADYQVPKALRAEGCIRYSEELGSAVDNQKLIPKHSLEECEIRAVTVLVCQQLVEKTGKNISDIDGYFWLRRKEYIAPFHLTITTDY
jgi:hypothetical protein